MDEYETLNHTTWDCKYHVVFIPKYRRKLLFQELKKAQFRRSKLLGARLFREHGWTRRKGDP